MIHHEQEKNHIFSLAFSRYNTTYIRTKYICVSDHYVISIISILWALGKLGRFANDIIRSTKSFYISLYRSYSATVYISCMVWHNTHTIFKSSNICLYCLRSFASYLYMVVQATKVVIRHNSISCKHPYWPFIIYSPAYVQSFPSRLWQLTTLPLSFSTPHCSVKEAYHV